LGRGKTKPVVVQRQHQVVVRAKRGVKTAFLSKKDHIFGTQDRTDRGLTQRGMLWAESRS